MRIWTRIGYRDILCFYPRIDLDALELMVLCLYPKKVRFLKEEPMESEVIDLRHVVDSKGPMDKATSIVGLKPCPR